LSSLSESACTCGVFIGIEENLGGSADRAGNGSQTAEPLSWTPGGMVEDGGLEDLRAVKGRGGGGDMLGRNLLD